jgi:PAS domain S-box-containing protein
LRAAFRKRLVAKAGIAERLGDVLSGILKVASDGVVVADNSLLIVMFSAGAEAIFGYKASEVVGQPLDLLMPAEHRPDHGDRVRRFADGAQQSRRMSSRGQVLGLRKSGETFPLEVGLSKVGTRDGHIFTAILRDVSEQKEAQAALSLAVAQANAANEAKSDFLAAMSHEIRTPLNGVLGMAQAMAMEDLPVQQRDRLDVIRRSGENLLAILNDLLDLSKIEAGKLVLEDAEFDVDHVARAAHDTFAAIASAKGLDLMLSVTSAAKGIYRGDPLRVRQILHNLISNALKFTETGGVTVCVSRKSGMLRFIVQDTGVGISAETATRLFGKFEQGDTTTTRRYGGTGLGLAICRDLAEMMGGSIVADSDGGGARFTVLLPLTRLGQSQASMDHLAVDASASVLAPDLRVLVAEDNGVNQLVLKTLLNQAGIEPVIVADGLAAVGAWEGEPWDLILMDVQMPEMDGPTATAVIRSREVSEKRRRTPIIALTANVMEHQLAEYQRAGMDGLVPKPIEVAELFAAILAHVDK